MTHTRHASARLKRASQLLCYSASLGCSHDPHRIPNLGVASSTDWVDEKVDDGDRIRPSEVSLSASPRAHSWASELQCDFRLIAENQMLPRREGARQWPRPVTVQLRDSMGYCLLPSTPPPPARRPPQPIPVHLITCPETRPRQPAVDFETAPPSLQFETCARPARRASSVAAPAAETTGQPEWDIFSFLEHVIPTR